MTKITNDDIKFYKDKGFLLPDFKLFDDLEFNELISIFEETLSSAEKEGNYNLDTPHFKDKRLFKYLLHEKVLDIVESIIGPDIGLFSSHFILKEPFTGLKTPWHEDSAYWKGRFDKYDKIATVWLAIDDAFKENGCMGVIPGSHIHGFSEYEDADSQEYIFDSKIKEDLVDESKVVWFELERGTFSLHDSRIIHGANANTSPKRRCGYTMRYFSLDMKYIKQDDEEFNIYYARGKNIAGNDLSIIE